MIFLAKHLFVYFFSKFHLNTNSSTGSPNLGSAKLRDLPNLYKKNRKICTIFAFDFLRVSGLGLRSVRVSYGELGLVLGLN
jgi:hypothetical protein